MNAMPSNSIPSVPTRDEALMLTKRRWEAMFQKWRSNLRHTGKEYGDVDISLDALTYDLRMQVAVDGLLKEAVFTMAALVLGCSCGNDSI